MMRLENFALVICSCITLIGCSFKPFSDQASLINLEIKSPSDLRPSSFGAIGTFSAPTVITGFSCLMVNVIGDGIPVSSSQTFNATELGKIIRRESYCSYPGVIAGPIDVSVGGSVSLSVPSGSQRLIQLLGVDTSTACTVSALKSSTSASIYEVGRSVVDLFNSTEVTLSNEYNSLTATEQTNRKVNCGGTSSTSYSSMIQATSGLIGYWTLGESAGTTATGLASTLGDLGYQATGVTYSVAGALSGQSDTSASFDGSTGRVLATTPGYAFNTSVSFEVWFKTTATCTSDTPFVNYRNNAGTNQIRLGCYTGKADFYIKQGANTALAQGTTAVNDGAWHHLVGVLLDLTSSNNVQVYLDGVLEGSVTTTSITAGGLDFTSAQTFSLAYSTDTSINYATVNLDEAAVYSSALSASTILAHYTKGSTGN